MSNAYNESKALLYGHFLDFTAVSEKVLYFVLGNFTGETREEYLVLLAHPFFIKDLLN